MSVQCVSVAVTRAMARPNKTNWYRDHIRNFVVPSILLAEKDVNYEASNVDYATPTRIDGKEYIPDLEAEQIVKLEIEAHPSLLTDRDYRLVLDTLNALENRSKGKAIILPGRDVWPFFVLMQKRKVFDDRIHHFPWMSRNATSNYNMVRSRMEAREISKDYLLNNCYLFDTGFAGSIFKGIANAYDLSHDEKKKLFLNSGMVSTNSYSYDYGMNCVLQENNYRSQVLKIEEGVPKYFHSGDHQGNMVLASRKSIMETARYTYDLWNGITLKDQTAKDRKRALITYKWCNNCKQYHKYGKGVK